MKKGRDVVKLGLAMLFKGGTRQTATQGTTAAVLQPYVLQAAVFALVCLVSPAAAIEGWSNYRCSGLLLAV
jgi:hypothetical protein